MEKLKGYWSVYHFKSDRVCSVTDGAELFNKVLRPMMPWFDIKLVPHRRPIAFGPNGGDVEFIVGGVEVLFTRVLGAVVCFAKRCGDDAKDQSERVYIERFCKVLDGASRDDDGRLKGIPK